MSFGVYNAEASSVTVHFIVDGETVVPDVSSVFYTLRDHDGTTKLVDNDPIVTDLTTTEVHIPVTVGHNTIAADTVENRYVRVNFAVNGKSYYISKRYSISDFIPLTGTPEDVRGALGLRPSEVNDEEVDLIANYFELKNDVGAPLDTALVATDHTNIAANRAIVLQTALQLLPSLKLRAIQIEQWDVNQQRRYAKIDWEALQLELSGELGDLIGQMTGTGSTPQLMGVFTTRPDPITGA